MSSMAASHSMFINDTIRLRHMLDATREAMRAVEGRTRDDS